MISRRDVLKGVGTASAGALLDPRGLLATAPSVQGIDVAAGITATLTPISPHTVRIVIAPIASDAATPTSPPASASASASGAAPTLTLTPPDDGALVQATPDAARTRTVRLHNQPQRITLDHTIVELAGSPLVVRIFASGDGGDARAVGSKPAAAATAATSAASAAPAHGGTERLVQELRFDPQSGALTFALGDGPLLGLGEGGPQFDRRGSTDRMRSGQGGYQLKTHGGRVPIQWLVQPGRGAMFIHHPLGSFDFTGPDGRFEPGLAPRGQAAAVTPPPASGANPALAARAADGAANPAARPSSAPGATNPPVAPPPAATSPSAGAPGAGAQMPPAPRWPLDLFVVTSRDPLVIMAEYARITGQPEMPPLWSLGYLQSHRTLANLDEVMWVAKTFREKRLPCDALIYLGTGFTPSGWNTYNGAFSFNPRVFPDPKRAIDDLRALHYRVVLHAVIWAPRLRGTVADACSLARFDEQQVGCYWHVHRSTFALGVDGWWPDEGDPLDAQSRLVRNRMYYEGPQLDRPNERPFALHRNGYAGMQRYASFLWSGDVDSTWATLAAHIPLAVNTGLSGIPLWGTDIGGFVPTKEYTGELHVRWFQFGAFCPLFRAHGRTWHLRLPWGWNTGDTGPSEISTYGQGANPDPSELHNADVEPICKQYLELRYQLLPYLYSAVREGCQTGLPIIRALWLHHPHDVTATTRGDQYLWGRDILVAPVTEKAATTRRVYLPAGGSWFDFWTEEATAGGREITRNVDLATMPLYVRAGAIVPFGPVKQYTSEPVDPGTPLALRIYPGADGAFTLYEDDGASFDYRKGEWLGIAMTWHDRERRLTLRLAEGSKMIGAPTRAIDVRLVPGKTSRRITFDGRPIDLRL